MSGRTRSMPTISSSGNIRPQSMTTIVSSYSITVMFLPTEPTPPRGITRTFLATIVPQFAQVLRRLRGRGTRNEGVRVFITSNCRRYAGRTQQNGQCSRQNGPRGRASRPASGADCRRSEQAQLFRGGAGVRRRRGGVGRGGPRRRGFRLREHFRDAPEILGEDVLQARIAQRGRRMVERVAGNGAVAGGPPVQRAHAARGKEFGHRKAAQRADHPRLDQRDLAIQVLAAGGYLVGQWVAIVRRPALQDVRNVDVLPLEPDRAQHLLEQFPGGADERARLLVLVVAGRLADEHDPGIRRPLARHGARPAAAKDALLTDADLAGQYAKLVQGTIPPAAAG